MCVAVGEEHGQMGERELSDKGAEDVRGIEAAEGAGIEVQGGQTRESRA